MESAVKYAVDAASVAMLGFAGLIAFSCYRRQYYERALAMLLLGAYVVALLDATKGHIRYAYSKRSLLAKDSIACASVEYRKEDSTTAKREQREERCKDVDLLGDESLFGLVWHSISQKGWYAFIMRHQVTDGLEYLANSHVGFYASATWFTGAAVLALLVFLWIRDRTRGIIALPYQAPERPVHEQSWLTSLHFTRGDETRPLKQKGE